VSAPSADDQEGGFSRRTVFWLIAVTVVSFGCAIGFAIFSEEVSTESGAGSHSFSRSAIGHKGIVELLRDHDIPVLVSEHGTAGKAKDSALVVAEPVLFEAEGNRAADLAAMVAAAPRALVVLPKWYGSPDPRDPDRIDSVALLPEDEVQPILDVFPVGGGVVRPAARASVAWQASGLPIDVAPAPDLVGPQLMTSDAIQPVLWTEDGTLLGIVDFDGTELWILSDPDLLSNHGLLRGDNATLALAVLDAVRGARGAVVFDETMHGFKSEPSLWRVLFEFPLVLATIQAMLAALLLLWAATGRFGKPVVAPPVIAPGKEFLIDNTAALLRFGGHAGHALRRYLQTTVQEVARLLHAPTGMDLNATARWLEQVAETRRVPIRLVDLEREVGEAGQARRERERRVVDTARRIYRWRQEMTHGSRDGTHNR
jgi:hypothetical protein